MLATPAKQKLFQIMQEAINSLGWYYSLLLLFSDQLVNDIIRSRKNRHKIIIM